MIRLRYRSLWVPAFLTLTIGALVSLPFRVDGQENSRISEAALGERLFFDVNLSLNRTQSCSTCHDPAHAFIDPRDSAFGRSVSIGDDGVSPGTRNTPSAGYASLTPVFAAADTRSTGGQFWDGRANDLAAQAGVPLLNKVEMALPDAATAVERIRENPAYEAAFTDLYGAGVFDDTSVAFAAIGKAIAAFENTPIFSPFDSRYDRWLRGEYTMTAEQELGRELFFSSRTICAACHLLRQDKAREPFSNYKYFNIGTPPNDVLSVVQSGPDLGLAANPAVNSQSTKGLFRNTGLRNVAVTGPYMHNGVFRNLRTVLLFYNHFTTDDPALRINPETGEEFGEPEVPDTVTSAMRTAPALSSDEIAALEAFLETLTDARFENLIQH